MILDREEIFTALVDYYGREEVYYQVSFSLREDEIIANLKVAENQEEES